MGVHFARARSDNLVIDAGVTVLFAPFSGQCEMLFEDEHKQATALRRVSLCAQRAERVVEHQPERCARLLPQAAGFECHRVKWFSVREAIVPGIAFVVQVVLGFLALQADCGCWSLRAVEI